MKPQPPLVSFKSQMEWEDYLSKNYNNQLGVWMKLSKKGSDDATINHQEALEVALMFGWIDGQAKTIDEKYWQIKFTPRRKQSIWSKRNCEIATRLIKDKKMKPTGLIQVEAAKQDGRFDAAYDSPKNMIIPDDFLNELSKDKKALEFFKTLNKTNTYAIVWRLQTAKKPETRLRRMKTLIEMLSREEKLHP